MDKLTKILTITLVLLLLVTIAFPSSLVSAASGITFTKTTYQTTESVTGIVSLTAERPVMYSVNT